MSRLRALLLGGILSVGLASATAAPSQVDADWQRQVGLLKSVDQPTRWSAVYALGQLGPAARPATSALIAVLANRDEDEYIRGGAAWALGRLAPKTPDAAAALVAALDSELNSVRANAAEALGAMPRAVGTVGQARLAALLNDDLDVRVPAAVALVRSANSAAALAVLKALAESANAREAFAAVAALGGVADESDAAAAVLVAALAHPEADVARCAAWTLGRSGGAGRRAVQRLLHADDARDRGRALGALAWSGPTAAADLKVALADKEPSIRRAAATALGRLSPLPTEDLREALLQAARDADATVRQAAAEALQKTQDK